MYQRGHSIIVEEHLAAAGITAPIHELPASTRTAAEAAEALGCEVGAIASSSLFVVDDEPVLVMTSGRHRVDPVQLGAALGVGDVRLASAERVRSVTGQAIGGLAPTGHPEPIRTVIDETLQQHPTIAPRNPPTPVMRGASGPRGHGSFRRPPKPEAISDNPARDIARAPRLDLVFCFDEAVNLSRAGRPFVWTRGSPTRPHAETRCNTTTFDMQGYR